MSLRFISVCTLTNSLSAPLESSPPIIPKHSHLEWCWSSSINLPSSKKAILHKYTHQTSTRIHYSSPPNVMLFLTLTTSDVYKSQFLRKQHHNGGLTSSLLRPYINVSTTHYGSSLTALLPRHLFHTRTKLVKWLSKVILAIWKQMTTELLTAICCILTSLYPEDGGRKFLRKIYTHLRSYTASHPRTLINQQADSFLND